MKVKELLESLDLGNSVAEFDGDLDTYFVETETFRQILQDRCDVIAGDKGTGKTALYRTLHRRYRSSGTLKDIELLTAFNPSGAPVFQRLTEGHNLNEGQFGTIWKSYIVALIGNWLIGIYGEGASGNLTKLDALLRRTGLKTVDDSATTVFSKLANLVNKITRPESAAVKFTVTPDGMPVVAPEIKFGDDDETPGYIDHRVALGLLNQCLSDAGIACWMLLDRLDEAFIGFPKTEVPALRALFRTYLDVQEFDRIRLKLFVRNDLFRRIIEGGFVNLTHVNARKIVIEWTEDDLLDLLFKRIARNETFLKHLNLPQVSRNTVFSALFPNQVVAGEKRPETWSWIISRIRDGNNIKPPRNLLDLLLKSLLAEQRLLEREILVNTPQAVHY